MDILSPSTPPPHPMASHPIPSPSPSMLLATSGLCKHFRAVWVCVPGHDSLAHRAVYIVPPSQPYSAPVATQSTQSTQSMALHGPRVSLARSLTHLCCRDSRGKEDTKCSRGTQTADYGPRTTDYGSRTMAHGKGGGGKGEMVYREREEHSSLSTPVVRLRSRQVLTEARGASDCHGEIVVPACRGPTTAAGCSLAFRRA